MTEEAKFELPVTNNETGETTSMTLTKEQYDEIISQSTMKREPTQVTLIKDPETAKEVWKKLFSEMLKTNVPIEQNVYDNAKKWKARPMQYLALLSEVESEDLKVICLLSQKTEKTSFYINLILTMEPIMTQPHVKMLLETLKRISLEEYKTDLIVPKRYLLYTDEVSIAEVKE